MLLLLYSILRYAKELLCNWMSACQPMMNFTCKWPHKVRNQSDMKAKLNWYWNLQVKRVHLQQIEVLQWYIDKHIHALTYLIVHSMDNIRCQKNNMDLFLELCMHNLQRIVLSNYNFWFYPEILDQQRKCTNQQFFRIGPPKSKINSPSLMGIPSRHSPHNLQHMQKCKFLDLQKPPTVDENNFLQICKKEWEERKTRFVVWSSTLSS